MEASGRAAPGFRAAVGGIVLSFLSEKEKKEPKKRNLIGEGMSGNQRVALSCSAPFFILFGKRLRGCRAVAAALWLCVQEKRAGRPLWPPCTLL